jgi:hypothetical protein
MTFHVDPIVTSQLKDCIKRSAAGWCDSAVTATRRIIHAHQHLIINTDSQITTCNLALPFSTSTLVTHGSVEKGLTWPAIKLPLAGVSVTLTRYRLPAEKHRDGMLR